MAQTIFYHRIEPGTNPPDIAVLSPFRAVVLVEAEVSPEWRSLVSDWLVQSGCLYMMAWGADCSAWDDSVDMSNIEAFEFGEIPDERFIMTTWHENESLHEVFWFSKNNASHPTVGLEHTVLVHISAYDRERELLKAYAEA
jgi:hypothetical protein